MMIVLLIMGKVTRLLAMGTVLLHKPAHKPIQSIEEAFYNEGYFIDTFQDLLMSIPIIL